MARSRPVETPQNVHEGRFPGTTRAHQRNKFATLDLKGNATHRGHFHFTGVVDLVYVDQPDERAVVHIHLVLLVLVLVLLLVEDQQGKS